jgi:hypothetical protein
MRPKSVLLTAGIALAVVIAHQKITAGAVPGVRVSA